MSIEGFVVGCAFCGGYGTLVMAGIRSDFTGCGLGGETALRLAYK